MRVLPIGLAMGWLCAGAAAYGQYAPGVDQGTLLSKNGIVAIPGQGSVAFPGGSTRAAYGFFGFTYYGYGATALNAAGVQRAVLNGSDITPAAYQAGGAISTQPDLTELINDGYDVAGFVSGTCSGTTCSSGPSHAAVWATLNLTFTDLHPAQYFSSVAQALDGYGNVVGSATDSAGAVHPLLWASGVAKVLKVPVSFSGGSAAAISATAPGGTRVDVLGGYGTASNGKTQPLVWNFANNGWRFIDVLPKGTSTGAIVAADPADTLARFGGSVVTAASKGRYHAALWTNPVAGTPNFTDLHPVGAQYLASSVYCLSASYGLEGGAVLVHAKGASLSHAFVWSGTAASAVDLQALLGTGFTQSVVTGIDAYGNAAGAALDSSKVWHLVTWAYTPPAGTKRR